MGPPPKDKKSPGTKSVEPPTMEESVIILPMMDDSVVGLGDLWDCHASLSPGNIFGTPFEAKHLEAFPLQSLEYTLYSSKNTSDKLNTLNITAEMKLDIAGGKINVSGSATYDEKDHRKFNEEEMLCTYNSSTYCVRTRPNVVELVDRLMKEKIVKREVRATHFVQSVRIGGQAAASIRYSKNIEDTNMTISGEFNGALAVGPVTASAKATMKLVDTALVKQYSTKVNVKCRPRFEKAPTNVTQMFNEIDKIDANVAKEQHFPQIGNHIVGIPLSFKLVPLNQLIDYEAERLYKMMQEDLMRDFTSMVFTCQDFQQPSYIKALIIQKEARLVGILRDESNPFTDKITKLEIECDRKAKIVKEKAFQVFGLYKEGEKTAEDIYEVIRFYDEEFNIIQLRADIQKLVEEGKRELTGVHASDVVDLKGELRFFSNDVDFKDWWTAERTIKILLQTNYATASPSGTFLRLFNLSGPLAKLNVEIGVAFPNISKDFSLTFKIRDKEVVYKGTDIVFALEVLGVAIESGDMMSSLFYTLNGVLSGLNLTSIAENLPDINSLVSIFKESRGVVICETYPQLLEALGETTDTWNFVIPLQGANTSIQMMKFFRQLREILPKQYKKVVHRWIVGKFNVEAHDSPLLFVFRDQELKGICLDHLDILILLHQLRISSSNPDLSVISHENMKTSCLYPQRANFAIKILEGLVLDHSTSLTDLVLPLPDFPYTIPKGLDIATKVTRTAAIRNELQVLNTIAMASTNDYPDLEMTFRKYGWTDVGFPTLEEDIKDKWKSLHADLERFLGNQAPYLVKVEGAIKSLRILKVPEDGNPNAITELKKKIADIVKFIVPDFGTLAITVEQEEIVSKPVYYKFRGVLINEEEEFAELKPEIESFKYSEVSVMLRGVLNSFEKFYNNELNDEENNFFNLVQLIILTEKLAADERTFKPILVDLAKRYCERALLQLDENEYPGAQKKIKDSITERNLFKTLGFLASFAQNTLIYHLTEEIYNLKTLANIEPVKGMIEGMRSREFTDAQLKVIWTNPKFLFLIRLGIENDALIKTIFVQICIERNPPEIPRFIPVDIAEKLKPLFHSMDEPKFNWVTKWNDDIELAIQALQILVTRKTIPSSFAEVLRLNIELNTNIRQAFKTQGVLFYWNEVESYFFHPWGLPTTQKALEALMAAPKPRKSDKPPKPMVVRKPKTRTPEPVAPPVIPTASVVTAEPRGKNVPPISVSRQSSYQPVSTDSDSPADQFDLTSAVAIPVNETWKRFTRSGFIDKISGLDLVEIKFLKPKPLVEYDELNKTLDQILPYLVQQAKMHNSTSLQPTCVVEYLKYPPTDGRPRPGYIDFDAGKRNDAERFLMSKGDLMTVLFNCSDPMVSHHILCSMMKSPMALPLIIPGIIASPAPADIGFKFVLPALQNLIVQELENIVPYPHLLTKPFRLVITLRVGDVGMRLGKSTIMNQLLMAHNNLFSCFAEPGAENGKPVSRSGLVEFTWLSKSKVNTEFYEQVIKYHYQLNQPDMVLLANLHGDALNFQPMLELLKTFTSSFVVFWKANNWNDLKAKKIELNRIIGGGSSVLDLVLYPDPTISDHVGPQNIILIDSAEEIAASKTKLHNVFREAIACKPKAPVPMLNGKPITTPLVVDDNLTYADPGILNFIGQCKTKAGPALFKFKISQFEEDNISCPESHQLLEFIREMTVQKVKEALISNTDEDENLLGHLTELVLVLLDLPLVKRNMALTHFSYELDYLSRKSSKLSVERILKLRKELESLEGQLDEEEMLELQNDVKAILTRLQVTTLTLQDIFRYLINEKSLEQVLENKYSEYFNSGLAVELFQPTYAEVMWDKPLEEAIQSIPQDTRIFVISAIGLKAAGKSTLLNRLFGAEFREGPAGCTNGLHMRFLWVDDRLRKELKCDAFCIIDSEGFGAPENFIDESADFNERNIASFILGISHLSIANVLGNEMKELKDILEVSFTTLTRVRDMLLTPDLVLVQQQLEPSSSEDAEGEGELTDEWSNLLNNVKKLSRENEMEIGVRVREAHRMETVKQRFKHDELLHKIRPLTDNAEMNSRGYHADIQNLYHTIMHHCQYSTQILTITDWYKFTKTYWEDIKSGATSPNKYKNAEGTTDAINLSWKVRDVKRAIDLAFRSHDKIIDEKFTEELDEYLDLEGLSKYQSPKADPELKSFLQAVNKSLGDVIDSCAIGPEGASCNECLTAFTLREALFEETHNHKRQFLTVDAIIDYMAEVKESLWGKYVQRVTAKQIQTGIIKQGMWDDLHLVWKDTLDRYQNDKDLAWVKYKQYVSTLQKVIPAPHRIDAEAAEEYAMLPHILPRLDPGEPLPDLEKMIAFDLGHYNKAVESAINAPKRETISWDKNDWLIAKMEDLPGILLTDSGVDVYLVGMTRELKNKMNEILDTFKHICGEELEPNFKWEVHLYALKTLKTFMEKKQREWDYRHNPLVQLEKRKEQFENLFEEE